MQQQFDTIICIECSEHLPDKAKLLRDCYARCAAGGKIAFCAWAVNEDLTESNGAVIDEILTSMLLPSLASAADYVGWAQAAGFSQVAAVDVSAYVQKTWALCKHNVAASPVLPLLAVMPRHVRDFVASFDAMQRGYESGALQYIMLRGLKV